jgi:hypothetical protein
MKKHHEKECPHSHYASAEPMMGEERHEKKKKKPKMFIASAIKHPGSLRKELHIKKGHKIPLKKLHKAAKSKGVEGKRARLAETLEKMHHKCSDCGKGMK